MTRTLEDRLIEWEEHRERGETVSAAALCTDEPALAPQLERLIGLLEWAERLLDVQVTEPIAPSLPAVLLPARIGRYQVRSELGRGGTCVVYRAWDPDLRREVALKVLRDEALGPHHQALLTARLGREAQTLAGLRHDHIVPIYEPGLSGGRPYFVLEYVRGGSLRERVEALAAAGPRAFVPLLERAARAVQFAHERGILHRDLKPANILLDPDGRPLVSDFGLAKLLDEAPAPGDETIADAATFSGPEPSDNAARLTASGFQPGTPAYMAPEQYDPAVGDVSPATDVWALGVILYELLTGTKPFDGKSRAQVQAQVCGGRLVRPRQRRPGVDRRLEAIALRCLQTDPRQRYQTAREFGDALAAWQGRGRRRRLLLVGAALAGLAALAGVFWFETSPERRYQRAVAPHLAALKRGNSFDFIAGAQEAPALVVRAGEQGTTAARTADGLTIDGRLRCCLVELCPEVRLEHYRVQAKLRLKNALSTDGVAWGVYVNHTALNTAPGPQHYFEAAYFLDDAGLSPRSVPPGQLTVEGALTPRWFSYHHQSFPETHGQYPYRNYRWVPSDPGHVPVIGRVPGGAADTPWRTLRIEVHAGLVSARCEGGGLVEELALGTIRAADREDCLHGLGLAYADLRAFNLPINGTAAGVYVDSAVVDVSEFVVEPLPAP
jgi:serine/threonine-protein kinase